MVRQQTNHALLFYSCGKDSIALLDMLAPQFEKVTVCFMYFVKDPAHCNRYLKHAETHYQNTEILQVPHFSLTSVRREGLYCNPEPGIKLLRLSDIDEYARAKTGATWSFYGMKKSDGLNRRLMLKSYGTMPISEKTRKAYPLADLNNKDVLRYIKANRLPQPVVYGGKRSFTAANSRTPSASV